MFIDVSFWSHRLNWDLTQTSNPLNEIVGKNPLNQEERCIPKSYNKTTEEISRNIIAQCPQLLLFFSWLYIRCKLSAPDKSSWLSACWHGSYQYSKEEQQITWSVFYIALVIVFSTTLEKNQRHWCKERSIAVTDCGTCCRNIDFGM